MPKPSVPIRRQCGAVPFMVDSSGRVRVALLTSRETQLWVIPKGWPMAKRSAAEAARREVREEAGLSGTIIDVKPVGHYGDAQKLLLHLRALARSIYRSESSAPRFN